MMCNELTSWDHGVLLMQLGERAQIASTPDGAYGNAGFPPWGVPPMADVTFEVAWRLLPVSRSPRTALYTVGGDRWS